MQTTGEKLSALREQMKQYGVDAYLIANADPHISEYAPAHYRERQWISGFSGSNGTVVVTAGESGLWTDGRYYIQAERQLKGSEIVLFRMSDPGVMTVEEFLRDRLPAGSTVALNGKLFSCKMVAGLKKTLGEHQISLREDLDLIQPLWVQDRPPISPAPGFVYPVEYAGRFVKDKLQDLRGEMEKRQLTHYFVGALDAVNWLFNLRGEDVTHTPQVFAFGLIEKEKAFLYLDPAKRTPEIEKAMAAAGVELKEYDEIYEDISSLSPDSNIGYRDLSTNAALAALIPQGVGQMGNLQLIHQQKARKNPVEQEWARKRHLQDGVVMVRFIRWLKEAVQTQPLTEYTVGEHLSQMRQQQDGCLGDSFGTIAGYGPNGAINHYRADAQTALELHPNGLLLVDSGGQYLGSTTDITRTIALGPLTQQEKIDFTLVLKCFIRLSKTRFLKGVTGKQLDVLSRGILWERGLDYKHGTGHGVGSCMGVHESPPNFSDNVNPLDEGMIISVEPGLYREGDHGIRTENLVMVTPDGSDPALGQFYRLEPLTMCPIDAEAILPEMLTFEEKQWLNGYHQLVRKNLQSFLTSEENQWLAQATQDIL